VSEKYSFIDADAEVVEGVGDVGGVVGAGVVEDDEFEVGVGLGEHAADGFCQEFLALVDGDADGHVGGGPGGVHGSSC